MRDRSRRKLTRSQKWIAVLALVVLVLGLGNLARLVMALHYAASLPDLPMTVSWAYLAAMGGFWCVAFLACVAGLVRLWPWARWGTLAAVTLYQAHVWINHFLFDASERAYQLESCNAAITLLLLVFAWAVLNWPSVRKEFNA